MKLIILVFACYISRYLSHAGTNVWTADEEVTATSLYAKYCSGSADRGFDGHISWVCKRPRRQKPKVESYLHVFEEPTFSNDRRKIIFVETPPNVFRHMVTVTGRVVNQPETQVFVVPGHDRHSVDVREDIKTEVALDKPSIFFLKNNIPEDTQKSTFLGYTTPSPVINDNTQSVSTNENTQSTYTNDNAQSIFFSSENTQNTDINNDSTPSAVPKLKETLPEGYIYRRPLKRFSKNTVRPFKSVREKRNFRTYQRKFRNRKPSIFFEEKPEKRYEEELEEKEEDEEEEEAYSTATTTPKSVQLHYRKRTLTRYGYTAPESPPKDDIEDFVTAGSSYYSVPYPHVRPVYRRPQN